MNFVSETNVPASETARYVPNAAGFGTFKRVTCRQFDMKATAKAHPIQGLVKYHGMVDEELRLPYHDSISVCTAPSHTKTTVEFDPDCDADTFVVDGGQLTGHAADRVSGVLARVRELADAEHADYPVRMESENSFPSNVGLGSSSSGFAAAATAMAAAADLDLSAPELSTIARRGSSSAARAVTGGFSDLHAGLNDEDCRSYRLESPLEDDLRIVAALVPAYKETEEAHREAADSHMFEARLAHVHGQLAAMRDALRNGAFDRAFELAEHDSLSLAATTMTGPAGWVYWKPETLAIFDAIRDLREEGVPAYFSTDTGASVYVNTPAEHVDRVEGVVADCGVETRVWEVGGPAEVLPEGESLF
jgi:phosphomevalonate decarboxylase